MSSTAPSSDDSVHDLVVDDGRRVRRLGYGNDEAIAKEAFENMSAISVFWRPVAVWFCATRNKEEKLRESKCLAHSATRGTKLSQKRFSSGQRPA
jgi:hypothetical protein